MKKSLFIAAFLFGGIVFASAQNTNSTTKSCCMKDANTKSSCCSKGTMGTTEVKSSCNGHTTSTTQNTQTTKTGNDQTSQRNSVGNTTTTTTTNTDKTRKEEGSKQKNK